MVSVIKADIIRPHAPSRGSRSGQLLFQGSSVQKYSQAWLAGILLLLFSILSVPVQANPVRTPHLSAELLSEVEVVSPGLSFWVALRFQLEPDWHTYWKNPGDSGEAPRLHWRLPPGFHAGEIHWPYPQRLPAGPLVNYGHADEAWLLVSLTAPGDISATRVVLQADANWLVCKEECIPESGSFSLELPIGEAAVSSRHAAGFDQARRRLPQALQGATVSAASEGLALHLALPAERIDEAWFFPDRYGLVDHAAPQPMTRSATGLSLGLRRGELLGEGMPEQLAGVVVVTQSLPDGRRVEAFSISAQPAATAGAVDGGLALALLLALGGGLLLNVMPCVFPVLSIKALHLARQAEASQAHARLGGLVFTAGVLIGFLLLAAALLALRAGGEAVGWGFQLQSAPFVLGLAWLMFALGLMLSGVWSFGAGFMGVGQDLAGRGGHVGAFFTGLLAVVVATPCTAPFMGAALGYALTRPAPYAMAVFLALGLGLAAPWLTLSFFPAARRLLPRPGPWMERFRQFLAFPMYATAAWLAWVLTTQTDATGLAVALAGMVLIGLMAWIWQTTRLTAAFWRRTGTAIVIAGIASLAWLAGGLPLPRAASPAQAAEHWEAYSPSRLDRLRAEGRPVLLNFTAAWCITCQVNERLALDTAPVRAALARSGVVSLRADWTRRDPDITRLLERHGRSGVPLTLLYPSGSGAAEVLPTVLTESLILERLAGLTPATGDRPPPP
jgi:thiol:disulfide interchange protein/DsbC/DsbD-like thiol-disulfide interchange protein